MDDSSTGRADRRPGTAGPRGPARPRADDRLARLITELQGHGLRVEVPLESRQGGAGPADAGMLWIDGFAATVPTGAALRADLAVRAAGRGRRMGGLPGRRTAGLGRTVPAPPLLRPGHGGRRPLLADRAAAPGLRGQHGHPDLRLLGQLGSVRVLRDRGHARERAHDRQEDPEMLAEVAVAARDLDGAVDATLTTGTTATPDKGALYVARCGQAVHEASGLPVEVQFEPPRDLAVIDRVRDMGIASVGIHVETFDPQVLARIAPAKARDRDRRLLPGLGAGGGRVRRGPGIHVRDPRHGRGPGPDRRWLPARHRHRGLPVRGAAAPDRGQPDGRPGRPVAGLLRDDLPPGRALPERAGHRRAHARRPAAPGARPVPG